MWTCNTGATASKKAQQMHDMRENAKAKSFYEKHCSPGIQTDVSSEEQHPTPVRVAVIRSDSVCRDCSSACAAQRSLLWPYWCFLSSLQDLSSAAGGESSPPLCFHWPQQEPTDESRVKLSKLHACHGIPDPYRNAFIVLKGWRHCLSKLEQTLLEKVAGTAAGTQFQSTVL